MRCQNCGQSQIGQPQGVRLLNQRLVNSYKITVAPYRKCKYCEEEISYRKDRKKLKRIQGNWV